MTWRILNRKVGSNCRVDDKLETIKSLPAVPSSMATKRTKSDIVLKVSVTSSRILEIGQTGIKTEQSGKGTITGRYRGIHWDTLEMQMNLDGTSSWQVKFIQMTDKGDMLTGTGS